MSILKCAAGEHRQVSGQNAAYEIVRQALSGLSGSSSRGIQKELEDLLESNQEAAEFVACYQDRDTYIGQSGCGPTCLCMAYLYFTEDTTENPRTMAEFADENGFYTVGGTSWSLWTEGAKLLGLSGQELPLDENRMKSVLVNDPNRRTHSQRQWSY